MRYAYTMVYRKLVSDADGGFYYQGDRIQENLSLPELVCRLREGNGKRHYRDLMKDADNAINSMSPDDRLSFLSLPWEKMKPSRNGHFPEDTYYVIEVTRYWWRPRRERLLSSSEVAMLIAPHLTDEILRRKPIE